MEWLNLFFRWIHVVAGIAWIGHLYFFNFVNAQVAKTYDADSKKKVVPELMPRALYWFRWGAAWTWITGILMLGTVYYMGMGGKLGPLGADRPVGMASAVGIGVLIVGFFVYDTIWKAMAKQEQAGVVVSFVLLAVAAFGLSRYFGGRTLFIHLGALFGTIMAANVWMRIWPAQRKIIAAIKAGQAPDAAVVALAGLRSKQNTYMSVPLVFFMMSQHFSTQLEASFAWVRALVFIILGWLATKWLFQKSASAVPKGI